MSNSDLTPEGIERPTLTIYAKPTRAEITKWAGYALRNSSIDYIDEELIEDFADGLSAFEARATPAPTDNAALVEAAHVTCQNCQGNGEIVTDWDTYMKGSDDDRSTAECPDCSGTGYAAAPAKYDSNCPDCEGTGERDSGGTHPWGAPAMLPCDCDQAAAPTPAPVESDACREALAQIARHMDVVGISQSPNDVADEAIKRLRRADLTAPLEDVSKAAQIILNAVESRDDDDGYLRALAGVRGALQHLAKHKGGA